MQCFPAEAILHSHPSEQVSAGHCCLPTGVLLEKTSVETVWGICTHRQRHWVQLMRKRSSDRMQDDVDVPVQMATVFKVLCPVASLDIFNDMGLEELPEELQCLAASHLRPKVVVAPQKIVQVIHSLGSCETAVIITEVRPVTSQRHASTEELNGFIPLYNTRVIWENKNIATLPKAIYEEKKLLPQKANVVSLPLQSIWCNHVNVSLTQSTTLIDDCILCIHYVLVFSVMKVVYEIQHIQHNLNDNR